jgi:predicted negative regulator of RcsB-dependent stress response
MDFDPGNLVNIMVAVLTAFGSVLGWNKYRNWQNQKEEDITHDSCNNSATKEELAKRDNYIKSEMREQFHATNLAISELKLMIVELNGNMKEKIGKEFRGHIKDYH